MYTPTAMRPAEKGSCPNALSVDFKVKVRTCKGSNSCTLNQMQIYAKICKCLRKNGRLRWEPSAAVKSVHELLYWDTKCSSPWFPDEAKRKWQLRWPLHPQTRQTDSLFPTPSPQKQEGPKPRPLALKLRLLPVKGGAKFPTHQRDHKVVENKIDGDARGNLLARYIHCDVHYFDPPLLG